jgi:hypothetical protein
MAPPLLTPLDASPDEVLRHVRLATSSFEVLACASLRDLRFAAIRMPGSVAVVHWQRIGGLLSEEHHQNLSLIDPFGAARSTRHQLMAPSVIQAIDEPNSARPQR